MPEDIRLLRASSSGVRASARSSSIAQGAAESVAPMNFDTPRQICKNTCEMNKLLDSEGSPENKANQSERLEQACEVRLVQKCR